MTQLSMSTSSLKFITSSKNLGSTILSPSTVINLSVSDKFAHALCAASEPSTPCTRFAQGTLVSKSA